MTELEAYQLIVAALTKVAPSKAPKVTEDTDLLAGGILDSLDVMNFLFEIEQRLGKKLAVIDETYNDFRVQRLIKIIHSA
jgi:acyl carrier protein